MYVKHAVFSLFVVELLDFWDDCDCKLLMNLSRPFFAFWFFYPISAVATWYKTTHGFELCGKRKNFFLVSHSKREFSSYFLVNKETRQEKSGMFYYYYRKWKSSFLLLLLLELHFTHFHFYLQQDSCRCATSITKKYSPLTNISYRQCFEIKTTLIH